MEHSVNTWTPPTNEQLGNAPDNHLHIAVVVAQCNFLHGKVLTIVDASYANPSQNKAVKDLVRAAFREQMDHMVSLSHLDSPNRPITAQTGTLLCSSGT